MRRLRDRRACIPEIGREAVRRGLTASIGETMLRRWLREAANPSEWELTRFPDAIDVGLKRAMAHPKEAGWRM